MPQAIVAPVTSFEWQANSSQLPHSMQDAPISLKIKRGTSVLPAAIPIFPSTDTDTAVLTVTTFGRPPPSVKKQIQQAWLAYPQKGAKYSRSSLPTHFPIQDSVYICLNSETSQDFEGCIFQDT